METGKKIGPRWETATKMKIAERAIKIELVQTEEGKEEWGEESPRS